MNPVAIEHLFPTPVFKYKVNTDINEDLVAKIRALNMRNTTVRQTVGNLHKQPGFEQFCTIALENARNALDHWGAVYEDIQITNCWANIYTHADSLQPHSHPNCFMSGVYYVKVPENSPPIFFYDPRILTNNIISPASRKKTIYNMSSWGIPMAEGMMLLWPAWMHHRAPENRTNDDRISIAFNIMFKGLVGSYETLDALEL